VTSPDGVLAEFRMSAFAALIGIRRYIRDHSGISAKEAAISLQRSDADFSAADFASALRLHELLPSEIDFVDPEASLRDGLSVLITTHRPFWYRYFPYGRQRLAAVLTQDELQTFRSAGLFDQHPPAVVAWWDALATLARSVEDERLNAQGRHAEKLSLEYERKRMASIGISEHPRWVALDDNSAGYDIQSFDQTPHGLKNILIEVKSSKRNPPRMILTRGEWDAAAKYGDSYMFHLWKLPTEQLIVKSVSEISAHIPGDSGDGKWTEVEIQF